LIWTDPPFRRSTPDDRFDGLAGYPFSPHYEEIPDGDGGKLRVHYVDEGPPL